MASGLEIFLIIFIFLLVIVGISLAIYFVWRHDQKKRDSGAPSNGSGNGSGGNGNGNGGNGNGGNGNGGNGNGGDPNSGTEVAFTSVAFPNLTWSTTNPDAPLISLELPDSSISCDNYIYSLNSNGNLVWKGDGTSIVYALPPTSTSTSSPVRLSSNTSNISGAITEWNYDQDQQIICARNNSSLCLFALSVLNRIEGLYLGNFQDTNDFKWSIVTQVPNSNFTCSSN